MSESEIHATMRALARKLVNAAATGNVDELKAIFDQNAVIWHNTDGLTVTMDDNLPIAAVFAAKVPHRSYEDIKITPFDGGYVQQHQWVGKSIDGEPFRLSACAIMHVRNGKIVRIDEYFDSAPFIRLGLDTWLPKN
jgi:ketosteroid isomerase-like protein